MKKTIRTDEEIRSSGLEALLRELGPDGMVRFFQQFGIGKGDYTRDRARLFPDGDLDELIEEVRSQQVRRSRRSMASG